MSLITLLLSLTVFSQNVTDTNKITLSYNIAKKVALDLISYDSLKSQCEITQNILIFTEQKSLIKDNLIKTLSNKNEIYTQQIALYKEKEQQYIDYTKILKKDIKKTKFKIQILSLSTIIITFTSALILYTRH